MSWLSYEHIRGDFISSFVWIGRICNKFPLMTYVVLVWF